jgi:RNA polymerase primary sigma factor
MSENAGDEVASKCGIYREPEEFGTSILILGFDDPSQDDEPSVADTCRAIQDSASRWYWPALEHGDLTVKIAGIEDGHEVFNGHSSSDFVEVSPFVSAMIDPVSETGDLEEPGDVIEKHISVKIPARTDGESGVVEARAKLRLRADAPTDDQTHGLEVALQRGTGMVVQNYQPRTKQKPALDVRGVLLAGKASGSEPEDHALEKFLRASEPPAHNSWDHTTQRLKSDYKTSGRKRAIESVYQQIDDAIGALVDEIAVDSDAVPEFLRKMLPLGGTGAREPKQRSRLKDSSGYLVDDRWQFEGTFENSRPPAGGWSFRTRIDIDQEGPGKKTVIPIEALEAPGCEVEEQGDGSSLVRVMPGISVVTFSGTTAKVPVFDPRRVKMKLLATLTTPDGEENEDE